MVRLMIAAVATLVVSFPAYADKITCDTRAAKTTPVAQLQKLAKVSKAEDEVWGQWWHFTSQSLQRLAEERFGVGNVEVCVYGNILAATRFLYGLAAADLTDQELNFADPLYEVIVAVRAVKRSLDGPSTRQILRSRVSIGALSRGSVVVP